MIKNQCGTKIYPRGLFIVGLVIAMGTVVAIFIRRDGLRKDYNFGFNVPSIKANSTIEDKEKLNTIKANNTIEDKEKFNTTKVNSTKEYKEQLKEQMYRNDSKTVEDQKNTTTSATLKVSTQNLGNNNLEVLPARKPKFVMNQGDANHNKYFKRNKDTLLANIGKAIEADCMQGWKHQQTILLHFGSHLPSKSVTQQDNFVIWYQTEQEGNPPVVPRVKKAMSLVDHVWDFSYHHVEIFGKDFVLKKEERYFYVPLWTALHPTFFHDHVADKWDWDVLLFGEINKRREAACNDLKKTGLRVHCDRIWGQDLENIMCVSKLLLNVHFYIPGVLEVHRINPALADGMVVVSEIGSDARLQNDYADVVIFAPYDDLVSTVRATLRLSPEKLAAKRVFNRRWIREKTSGVDPQLCNVLKQVVKAADMKFSGPNNTNLSVADLYDFW